MCSLRIKQVLGMLNELNNYASNLFLPNMGEIEITNLKTCGRLSHTMSSHCRTRNMCLHGSPGRWLNAIQSHLTGSSVIWTDFDVHMIVQSSMMRFHCPFTQVRHKKEIKRQNKKIMIHRFYIVIKYFAFIVGTLLLSN